MTEPFELQKMLRTLRLMAILRNHPQTFAQIQEILQEEGASSRRNTYRYLKLFWVLTLWRTSALES